MSIEETMAEQHRQQGAPLLKKNMVGNRNSDELLLSMRHFMCAWILLEATPEQLLEIVDKYKRSQFN